MWGDVAVVGSDEWSVVYGGLLCEDVEACSEDLSLIEGFGQGSFVDEGSAACVYDDGCLFHHGEGLAVDDVSCLGGQGAM